MSIYSVSTYQTDQDKAGSTVYINLPEVWQEAVYIKTESSLYINLHEVKQEYSVLPEVWQEDICLPKVWKEAANILNNRRQVVFRVEMGVQLGHDCVELKRFRIQIRYL